MKTINITSSGRKENIGTHNVWPHIWSWRVQDVYLLRSNSQDRVLKILSDRNFVKETLLGWFDERDFVQTCFSLLSSVEESWVVFPSYWDVVEWENDWKKVQGFIQTYYEKCDFLRWGRLPKLSEKMGWFSSESPMMRDNDCQEFFDDIFLDWDTYLIDVISQQNSEENFTDFCKRIASTKV